MCFGAEKPAPVVQTVKTPIGETGAAAPALKRNKQRSLLSGAATGDTSKAVVDSSQAFGLKQTLGA